LTSPVVPRSRSALPSPPPYFPFRAKKLIRLINFQLRRISILVLLLLGVATSRHISYYDDDTSDRPIMTKSQERRICAELCMAGLGGEPCGDECLDVIPQGLPIESSQSNDDHTQANYTRKDACPLLCANRLGYPLCGCNYTQETTPFFTVDFLQICLHFCTSYNYRIYGCNECGYYANLTGNDGIVGISGQTSRKAYDWNAWCIQMCEDGDGGSACYCDLLPMSLHLK
jgi:hypothetical protein